jgi:hypothetical protein
MITWRDDKLDDRLLVWSWKTGLLLVNMVSYEPPLHKENLICREKLDYTADLSGELVRTRVFVPR